MSLITGVSTDTEFLEAINNKGASLTNESTAYDLATAIDATGGNVSWLSPNETVVAAVNAEVPAEPVDVTYTVHYATAQSESHYYKLAFTGSDSSIAAELPLTNLTPGTRLDSFGYNQFIEEVDEGGTFIPDLSKTKVTIGETSYVGAQIMSIPIEYGWLRIVNDSSGLQKGLPRDINQIDLVPNDDVNIEIFETGYTE